MLLVSHVRSRKTSRLVAILTMLVLFVSPQFSHAAKVITHALVDNENEEYSLGLLKIALSYYPGKYKLSSTDEVYSQAKQLIELESGGLSVIWAGTTREMEDSLRPIRIPLFKGLLGHRIFIIRRDKQGLFNSVNTIDDLRRIPLGQGTTWGDTQLLRGAGMEVVTTHKYENLFPMLEGGRFDAFPRGVHEPWAEIIRYKDLDLTVETELMVVYPFALYFFVSRDNPSLGRDIENGLEKAIADGTFDKHFYGSTLVQNVIKNAGMENRKVFRIGNPTMHPDTPLDRKELWYDSKGT